MIIVNHTRKSHLSSYNVSSFFDQTDPATCYRPTWLYSACFEAGYVSSQGTARGCPPSHSTDTDTVAMATVAMDPISLVTVPIVCSCVTVRLSVVLPLCVRWITKSYSLRCGFPVTGKEGGADTMVDGPVAIPTTTTTMMTMTISDFKVWTPEYMYLMQPQNWKN